VESAKEVPLWVLTAEAPSASLRKKGVEITQVKQGRDGRLDPHDMLLQVADRGITRLLVEGGAALSASLLAAGLVDRLIIITSGILLGGDGMSAMGALGLKALAQAPRFQLEKVRKLGADVAHHYRLGA
jgi:diaminohydroxyphosphoribosylaminopyrimidine deaminase/5-amino-6-(5-phosphoribosylamino)uracil reductase